MVASIFQTFATKNMFSEYQMFYEQVFPEFSLEENCGDGKFKVFLSIFLFSFSCCCQWKNPIKRARLKRYGLFQWKTLHFKRDESKPNVKNEIQFMLREKNTNNFYLFLFKNKTYKMISNRYIVTQFNISNMYLFHHFVISDSWTFQFSVE